MTPLAAGRIIYLLLATNIALALAANVLQFIPSDAAIVAAFAYASFCALLYMLGVKYLVENIHRMPVERQASLLKSHRAVQTIPLSLLMFGFAFVAFGQGISCFYTWAFGRSGETLYSIESVRWISGHSYNCYLHNFAESGWLSDALGGPCWPASFEKYKRIALSGENSVLGTRYDYPPGIPASIKQDSTIRKDD